MAVLIYMLVTAIASVQTAPIDIYYLHMQSDIRYRFATTLVTSKVANRDSVAHEITFDVTLPNEAFITNVTLLINEVMYVGEVKEKEEAKRQYDIAKERGQTSVHVSAKPRETNKFVIEINVEAKAKVTFNLKYQELLMRKRGIYNHVMYINPGQSVEDFRIDVSIQESRDISNLRVPPLRNEILTETDTDITLTNEIAVIERPDSRSAIIQYYPNVERQTPAGIDGQFVVEYDVDRDRDAGDLLVVNGYFVHFFAPSGIPEQSKDIVFILDKSGSMKNRKIEQLKDAMMTILGDIREEDRFNILTFNGNVYHWSDTLKPATQRNIRDASTHIRYIVAAGSTNIDLAMKRSLLLLANRLDTSRTPVIVFLTDGQPTAGVTNTVQILKNVARLNEMKVPIFSLAFGENADYAFARKMSAENNGFARKIYEVSDAALQISGFYSEFSSVLMQDVTFTYMNSSVERDTLTDYSFRTLFEGTEKIVAGKLSLNNEYPQNVIVTGKTVNGILNLVLDEDLIMKPQQPDRTNDRDYSIITEKLWAYLTIKELLKRKEITNDETESERLKRRIIQMSLKYNFVTPLTSMVVILPDVLQARQIDDDVIDVRVESTNVQNRQHSYVAPQLPKSVVRNFPRTGLISNNRGRLFYPSGIINAGLGGSISRPFDPSGISIGLGGSISFLRKINTLRPLYKPRRRGRYHNARPTNYPITAMHIQNTDGNPTTMRYVTSSVNETPTTVLSITSSAEASRATFTDDPSTMDGNTATKRYSTHSMERDPIAISHITSPTEYPATTAKPISRRKPGIADFLVNLNGLVDPLCMEVRKLRPDVEYVALRDSTQGFQMTITMAPYSRRANGRAESHLKAVIITTTDTEIYMSRSLLRINNVSESWDPNGFTFTFRGRNNNTIPLTFYQRNAIVDPMIQMFMDLTNYRASIDGIFGQLVKVKGRVMKRLVSKKGTPKLLIKFRQRSRKPRRKSIRKKVYAKERRDPASPTGSCSFVKRQFTKLFNLRNANKYMI